MPEKPPTALHLTASMGAVKAHGHATRLPNIAWTKRPVLEAASETNDPDLLRLRARLESLRLHDRCAGEDSGEVGCLMART